MPTPHAINTLAPLSILGAAIVFAASCGTTPEVPAIDEMAAVRAKALPLDLVDVTVIAPRVVVDLRYGLADNVTRNTLYPPDFPCLLRSSTAAKLAHASEILATQGYRIIVWDAYRPPEVQIALWELTGSKLSNFVGNPHIGWSAHCCGVAVDIALADAEGNLLAMPTGFDHFGAAASLRAPVPNPLAKFHRDLIQDAMAQAGFEPYSAEWWHFEDPDYRPLGAEDVIRGRSLGIPFPAAVHSAIAGFERQDGPAIP